MEGFSQFRFSTGYIFEFFTRRKDPEKVGLRPGNTNYSRAYKILYGDTSKIKIVKYRTDHYGTIVPSTITKAKDKINKSTLFCGGSTTDAASVYEGQRVPDIYAKITGNLAINASRSGKDLNGCIKTIEYILQNHEVPQTIVIATSANTLGMHIRESPEHNKKLLSNNKLFNFNSSGYFLKQFIRKSFKVITPGLAKSRFHIKKQEDGQVTSSGILNIDNRFIEGCCYIPGKVNLKGSGIKFDWENKSNQQKYKVSVESNLNDLNKLLERYDINKDKIFFFIEPNSFLNKKTSAKIDLRQYLHNIQMTRVNGITSAKWIKIYDDIYANTIKEKGFKVLQVKNSDLRSEYFFDAVHLSPSGSIFIGKFYAENL